LIATVPLSFQHRLELVLFWIIREHAAEGLGWLEQILDRRRLPPAAESRALLGAGAMRYSQAELGPAPTKLALELTRETGDATMIAHADNLVAHVRRDRRSCSDHLRCAPRNPSAKNTPTLPTMAPTTMRFLDCGRVTRGGAVGGITGVSRMHLISGPARIFADDRRVPRLNVRGAVNQTSTVHERHTWVRRADRSPAAPGLYRHYLV